MAHPALPLRRIVPLALFALAWPQPAGGFDSADIRASPALDPTPLARGRPPPAPVAAQRAAEVVRR